MAVDLEWAWPIAGAENEEIIPGRIYQGEGKENTVKGGDGEEGEGRSKSVKGKEKGERKTITRKGRGGEKSGRKNALWKGKYIIPEARRRKEK